MNSSWKLMCQKTYLRLRCFEGFQLCFLSHSVSMELPFNHQKPTADLQVFHFSYTFMLRLPFLSYGQGAWSFLGSYDLIGVRSSLYPVTRMAPSSPPLTHNLALFSHLPASALPSSYTIHHGG
jgi:hypothetical protein